MQFELGSLETRHSPSHPQIYTSAGVLPAHHDFLGMGSCGGKRTAGYTAEPHTQILLIIQQITWYPVC